jgi:hypothetical protein
MLTATFAARLGCALAVLGKIAWVVLGPAATMAVFTAFATCFCGPGAVVGKIARAVFPADMTGTRRLLAIFGKIARIPNMSLLRHCKYSFLRLTGIPSPLQRT